VQLLGSGERPAMLIHERAVLTDQDRKYVYVVGEDNLAQRKDVRLGGQLGEMRIVLSGLAAKDRVVVNGVRKIFFPGMPVAPQLVPMNKPDYEPPPKPAPRPAKP
jgi:membrane fusion protein, multidrug efflux system